MASNSGSGKTETIVEAVARIKQQRKPGRQTRVNTARLTLNAIITKKEGSNGQEANG
ncbi:MAG: hypothetical protein AB7U82_27715 [Blastocatellales bacterium]